MDIENDINLVNKSLQTFAAGDRFITGRLSRLYKLELSLEFSDGVSNLLSNEVQKSD